MCARDRELTASRAMHVHVIFDEQTLYTLFTSLHCIHVATSRSRQHPVWALLRRCGSPAVVVIQLTVRCGRRMRHTTQNPIIILLCSASGADYITLSVSHCDGEINPRQVSTGGFVMDTSVFWASNMSMRPDFLLPQPPHHLKNMCRCSKNVDCTQLQHVDPHTAVFACRNTDYVAQAVQLKDLLDPADLYTS